MDGTSCGTGQPLLTRHQLPQDASSAQVEKPWLENGCFSYQELGWPMEGKGSRDLRTMLEIFTVLRPVPGWLAVSTFPLGIFSACGRKNTDECKLLCFSSSCCVQKGQDTESTLPITDSSFSLWRIPHAGRQFRAIGLVSMTTVELHWGLSVEGDTQQ